MNVGDKVELMRVGEIFFSEIDDGSPVFTRSGIYEGEQFQLSERVEEGEFMYLGNKNRLTVLHVYDDGSIDVRFTEREASHPLDF